MSYEPPDLIVAGDAPVVGGVSVLALGIPAPGAGRRIRVWWFTAGIFGVGGAAALARFALTNPVGSAFDTISFSYLNGSGHQHNFPGGIARPVNEGVSVFGIASAAANQYWVSVGYTIESA